MLEIEDLTVNFRTEEGEVCAVDSVSFSVANGETLAIVGESGSGKSVTALSLTRLLPQPPAYIVRGEVLLDRQPLLRHSIEELRKIRAKQISSIVHEPATSLNPSFT